MSRVRVAGLLLFASLLIASCRLRAAEVGKDAGPAQSPGGEASDGGGEGADFVLAGANFSFRGHPLPFCEPPSAWTAVLGESWSRDWGVGWDAPYFLTCEKSLRGGLIRACLFLYRETSNNSRQSTWTVSVDGARIGPETIPSELNLRKRGTKLVSLWDPLLYETRRDHNTDPYFVEVQFNRTRRLDMLTISVLTLAKCAENEPPPPHLTTRTAGCTSSIGCFASRRGRRGTRPSAR